MKLTFVLRNKKNALKLSTKTLERFMERINDLLQGAFIFFNDSGIYHVQIGLIIMLKFKNGSKFTKRKWIDQMSIHSFSVK